MKKLYTCLIFFNSVFILAQNLEAQKAAINAASIAGNNELASEITLNTLQRKANENKSANMRILDDGFELNFSQKARLDNNLKAKLEEQKNLNEKVKSSISSSEKEQLESKLKKNNLKISELSSKLEKNSSELLDLQKEYNRLNLK
ncbi:hypothetical protein [Halpernia frigidisoli]|uniref:Uncharacterized protein n=1 Tax=Halpernia frigidisoli TaxID=1125876 RepID=A0A1I3CV11_9FLAO|nr:hypothetical protein [Halpernia frigidisoli]SFH78384.1 hypothetical protein SAMN05443292_0097 [Halpernia frigidisoli]